MGADEGTAALSRRNRHFTVMYLYLYRVLHL